MIGESVLIASTVAVLLVYGGHFAALWSGDSRVYRLRQGVLEQLTRDHAAGRSGMVIHAIGVGVAAVVETVHGPLVPGDRSLLCSDGITKVLDDADLQRALAGDAPGRVVESLIQDCLVAGAADNITAVIVDAAPT